MSIAWYREAAANLGVMSLLRLQLAKRFGAKASLGRLSSRHLRHPIWYRGGTSDMSVFHQIFVEREYACVDSLKNVRFIVDCGANVGYSSAYFLSRFPEAFVVAIEPDPANYALLQRNLAPYAGRYRTMQAAVWSVPTTLYFDVETLGDGAEWGRTVGEDGRSGAAVEAIDLATILAGEGRSRIDLLKVDIEGAESEVFSRNTEGWIGAVDNFVMEVHGPDCQNAVDRAIAGRGFAISEHGELMVGIGQR